MSARTVRMRTPAWGCVLLLGLLPSLRAGAEPRSVAQHAEHSPRRFPSLRVDAGASFARSDPRATFDVSAGVHVLRIPGLAMGALVGVTRRVGNPEFTAFALGVPIGYVTRRALFEFGTRLDVLLGRAGALPAYGGRASIYVAYRQTLFVEGGVERLRLDAGAFDGARVVMGVDLGALIYGLATFRMHSR